MSSRVCQTLLNEIRGQIIVFICKLSKPIAICKNCRAKARREAY
nr:hypothetical protein YFYBSXGO_YFYBSXGO_CDS_0003 [Microvirus sp.]CAI9750449.1 hypothetical protein NQHBVCMM_NQHBVCMM_CDS_0003 [Microvirus sp.]